MKRFFYYCSLIILMLTACTSVSATPSKGDIETAIARTLSAQPTSTDTTMPSVTSTPSPTLTPTKIPLSGLDLEPLLIQPGDLPDDISGGQISDTPPKMFDELPQAENEIDQRLERDGNVEGGVTVFLYEKEDNLQLAYKIVIESFADSSSEIATFTNESITGVGEKSEYSNLVVEMLGMKTDHSSIAFIRCNALVHIGLSNIEQRQIVSYAHKLDKRLAEIICESPTDIPEPVINTSTPEPTLDLSLGSLRIFEDLGEVTSADVRVVLNKVICMDKPTANTVGIKWPEIDELVDTNYICTFFVVIHNGADRPVAYNHAEAYFMVGDIQASLADCMQCISGIHPFDAIQPGVTAEIAYLMPFSRLPDTFPVHIMIVLGKLFDPDGYDIITEKIVIEKNIEGR